MCATALLTSVLQFQAHGGSATWEALRGPDLPEQVLAHDLCSIPDSLREEEDWIPRDYHLREEEWGDEGYPVFENIPFGKRGSRKLPIALPRSIWLSRAVQWVRYLHVMDGILDSRS